MTREASTLEQRVMAFCDAVMRHDYERATSFLSARQRQTPGEYAAVARRFGVDILGCKVLSVEVSGNTAFVRVRVRGRLATTAGTSEELMSLQWTREQGVWLFNDVRSSGNR